MRQGMNISYTSQNVRDWESTNFIRCDVQTLSTEASSASGKSISLVWTMANSNAVADSPKVDQKGASSEDDQSAEHVQPVSFLSLFSGSDAWDILALTFGVTGALINGATLPMFAFVFGEVRCSAFF